MTAAIGVSALDIIIAAVVVIVVIVLAYLRGGRRGVRGLRQRLLALGTRLGAEAEVVEPHNLEESLNFVERATDRAAEAVAESSADAIRLRRALDTLPQAVLVCDEHGEPVFRNAEPSR